MLERILAESPSLKGLPRSTIDRVQAAAPELFAQLWKPIREEADARAVQAVEQLKARGRDESDKLKRILADQRDAIERRLAEQPKLEFAESEREQRLQLERDKKHMERRLTELAHELTSEPAQIESLYKVELHRLQPVGLVVLWPATRS
jgi:hypothetical protein